MEWNLPEVTKQKDLGHGVGPSKVSRQCSEAARKASNVLRDISQGRIR